MSCSRDEICTHTHTRRQLVKCIKLNHFKKATVSTRNLLIRDVLNKPSGRALTNLKNWASESGQLLVITASASASRNLHDDD